MFVDHIAPRYRDAGAAHRRARARCAGLGVGGPLLSAVVPGQRAHAPVPRRRGGQGRRPVRPPLRRHDPGRLRRARARALDGRRRRVGRAAVPDVPALRRQPLPRSRRQGPRARVCAGVERLDARRVVRRVSRAVHPADDDPAVGPAARGARDRALRGEGIEGASSSSRTRIRSGCRRSRAVTGIRCSRPRPTPACRCRCTSARRRGCSRLRPTRRRRSASRCAA